jgi:diguanylate cyclase (GGDEF)-like protein/PAS domain S-box-containing protein
MLDHLDHCAERWRNQERLLRALVEHASDMITVVAPDLTILFQAASAARLLGRSPDELEGTKFGELVDGDGLRALRIACAGAADGLVQRPVQLRLRRSDGDWLDGETVVRYDADEGCLILTTRDVSERKHAERQLRRRGAQQAVVVRLGGLALAGQQLPELMRKAALEIAGTLSADHAGILEYVADRDAFVPFVSVGVDPYQAAGTLSGDRSQPGATMRSQGSVIVRDWGAEARFDESELIVGHGLASGVGVVIPGSASPFGAIVVHSAQANRFNYEDGVFLQAVANVLAGAIARSEGEERIRHQALHDSVTGRPNRTLFADRVTRALTTARRRRRRLAILFMDLDNFKRINDSLGHAIGDVLLQAVAERLASCLRAEDTLARFGGDEFAILLPEIDSEGDVVPVVGRIQDALRAPLTAGGRRIVVSASIGVAIGAAAVPDESAQTLVRNADLAMYSAKQQGPGRWAFFTEDMYDSAVRRLDLTADLYDAMRKEELEVYFQPIVSLESEEIVGMEALVRWNHPLHGLLPPAAFMPLAEETGLLIPLGRFVLFEACRNLRRWQKAQPQHERLCVSVNVGAQELGAPDFAAEVKAALRETGLNPSTLILEITEDVLLATDDAPTAQLTELKELGVRLAVDDFGTGYSALSHLQRFRMDIIKIDKSFVDGLGDNGEQLRLVEGIIELAHGLQIETVAEGIEEPEQAALLRAMHSDLGQGFHFARPLPSRDIDAILSPVPHPDAAADRAIA